MALDRAALMAELEKNPLGNIVLLKHLTLFPDHAVCHHAIEDGKNGFLVALNAQASPYDRETYPAARSVILIGSDGPESTRALLRHVPTQGSIVFKLTSPWDRDVVAARFPLEPKVVFHSFTAEVPFTRDGDVVVGVEPVSGVLDLLAAQGHDRTWVREVLSSGQAFTCSLWQAGTAISACFAFQNHGRVWEVGGVYTLEAHRGRGLAAKVVRAAHAVLVERGLLSRYHVQAGNAASLALARKIGLQRFLTLSHYLHRPQRST
ncbi:hypothetical protein BJF93_15055 [Xaviernesmea oryzae]|uniref:N-acetyltransferase domain-containing protein n=1 Tax=Xaviernesmea oryzae TaxID=464029 RepID=A0A1Q9AXW0_9HYPH|nr:GNAT family N-acetyltransferase [Xaviernesmea oryzae]OLP60277.1 hypothetical protein BJF93_15055 [Xaviernesmea oryzae]